MQQAAAAVAVAATLATAAAPVVASTVAGAGSLHCVAIRQLLCVTC